MLTPSPHAIIISPPQVLSLHLYSSWCWRFPDCSQFSPHWSPLLSWELIREDNFFHILSSLFTCPFSSDTDPIRFRPFLAGSDLTLDSYKIIMIYVLAASWLGKIIPFRRVLVTYLPLYLCVLTPYLGTMCLLPSLSFEPAHVLCLCCSVRVLFLVMTCRCYLYFDRVRVCHGSCHISLLLVIHVYVMLNSSA